MQAFFSLLKFERRRVNILISKHFVRLIGGFFLGESEDVLGSASEHCCSVHVLHLDTCSSAFFLFLLPLCDYRGY